MAVLLEVPNGSTRYKQLLKKMKEVDVLHLAAVCKCKSGKADSRESSQASPAELKARR
jgi:hypothetical protein